MSSNNIHAIDYQRMNNTSKINISIITNARHEDVVYLKQNFQKNFDFNCCDFVSRFLLIKILNSLQINFQIDVICDDLKHVEKNKQSKQK